ncbi:MAG: polyprenyl synthetase family protein [Cyclobacteriaceae bacterium]|nr:polyprenyl synthetase family protein [Cyclobacteriaceae bacterium]
MEHFLKEKLNLLEKEIHKLQFGKEPAELYDPIKYILSLGGKKMRPLLTLLGYSIFKDDVEAVVKPALAVEVFHNFTLMHDDIMDKAPLRRGKATVHERWSENVAILSGDVMLVKAYDLLLDVEPAHLRTILQKFNQCAAEVCEGQQIDMNFESRNGVSDSEYIDMIRLKTAVLLGFSLEMGAILAGADARDSRRLYDFGVHLGIGFQLMDDILDVYANKEKFGKQVGGDIISNKKTFLLIKAREKASGKDAKELKKWLEAKTFNNSEKVDAITAIYNKLSVRKEAEDKMNAYYELAFKKLDEIEGGNLESIDRLKNFAKQLIQREK